MLAAPTTLWLLAAFAGPLVVVVLLAFQASSDPFAPISLALSLEQFRMIAADSFTLGVVAKTTALALSVCCITAVLAYPIAFWLVGLDQRWRALAFAVVLVPLLTNVVVRSLGIVLLLAPDGLINGLLSLAGLPRLTGMLFTWGAVALGLVQVFLPFMVLALYDVVQASSPRVREAAESLGASPAMRFLTVELPLSLPGLKAGMIIVFLLGSTAYVSAAMLGGQKLWTTGMLVWQESLQSLNAPAAAALALIMTLVGIVVTVLFNLLSKRLTPWLALRAAPTHGIPVWLGRTLDRVGPGAARLMFWIAIGLLLLPLALVFVQSFNDVPQATVAGFRAFTWKWYGRVLSGGGYVDSFLVSFQLALSSALLGIALSLPAAFALARTPFRGRSALAAFWTLPLSLPHVAIAVGMLRLLQVFTGLPAFFGLMAVHVTLMLPFCLGLLVASVMQLDRAQEEAAESLGAGPVRRFLLITLPGLAPGLFAAFVIGFLLSFEEVTVTSFLTTARMTTLPVRIYAESSFSLEPTVHAVSTLLILLTVCAMALAGRMVKLDRLFAR